MVKLKQYIKERPGADLRAEIFSDVDGYTVQYFVNDVFQLSESYAGKSIHYVEDAAHNWLGGIKVLNG
jgi:hypothetical protein